MRFNLLLLLLLSKLLFVSTVAANCDGKTIDKCTKCDTGEDSDSCGLCEDKYFPFLGNYFCLPCNDSTYGQIGCQGSCNGTNFTTLRTVFCNKEGCADGYINDNGQCISCKEYSSGCLKCSYKTQTHENSTYETFMCLECESNQYKISYGYCQHCSL